MTTFVKNFIQKNKDLINSSDWFKLCDNWLTAADKDFEYEDKYFQEFCDILGTSGINFLSESAEARKLAIENQLLFAMQYYETSSSVKRKSIKKKLLIDNWLASKMAFSKHEILQISDELAEDKGFIDTGETYTF